MAGSNIVNDADIHYYITLLSIGHSMMDNNYGMYIEAEVTYKMWRCFNRNLIWYLIRTGSPLVISFVNEKASLIWNKTSKNLYYIWSSVFQINKVNLSLCYIYVGFRDPVWNDQFIHLFSDAAINTAFLLCFN